MYKVGIVGIPNVGKTSLFKSLTGINVKIGNFPFSTIDPNVAEVPFKDEKLDLISSINNSKSTIYSFIGITDVPGLIKNSSKGEGLGNKFLNNIKNVSLICHVVRSFINDEIIHICDNLNPIRDFKMVNEELIMSDLIIAESSSKKNRNNKELYKILIHIIESLSCGKMIHQMNLNEKELFLIKCYNFLTAKPMIVLINSDNRNKYVCEMEQYLVSHSYDYFILNSFNTKILNYFVGKCFDKLNLIQFFTTGTKESKSWVLRKGEIAKNGARLIHEDIANKLIKVEVISYDDFILDKKNYKYESKDYIIQNNDIILFHFNKR